MANHAVTAVDIAKNIFEVAVSIQPGRAKERKRLPRKSFLCLFATRPQATVVMEACGSAHYWAREIEKLGHQVVLLPPSLVAPYRKRNKTDRADAKALLEAFRDEDIHPVPIKSVYQQTLTSLHRARSKWMQARTATINTVRGLLRELGEFIPALVAFVGDAQRFKNGRRFACYLGLTPKENSTGGKRRLGRISKQGNPYLRHLLIHCARSMIRAAGTKTELDRLRSWALDRAASRGPHKGAAAVANKLARTAWAIWAKNTTYCPQPVAA
jgi:transposase